MRRWKVNKFFRFLPERCFCGKRFTGYWLNYQICDGSYPHHQHWCYLLTIFDDTVKTKGYLRYIAGYKYLGFKITNCGEWHGKKGNHFEP